MPRPWDTLSLKHAKGVEKDVLGEMKYLQFWHLFCIGERRV